MAKQNENELRARLKMDSICRREGCMHQAHHRTIRHLQDIIAKLEEKIRVYEKS